MAVLAGKGGLGGSLVEPFGLEDEADLVERCGHGEFPHAPQRQRHLAFVALRGRGLPPVQLDRSVALDIDERRMSAGDHSRGSVSAAEGMYLDVELLLNSLLQGDRDAFFVDEAASLGHGLGRYVAQHLQLVFRPADQRPERHGDRQTDHPRTGNSHAHGVLENVGTQQHLESFGPTAQRLGGTGCTQRHRNRFGTTDRRDDFAFDQGDDLRPFLL